jgi:transcriptional regulator with XRE-family HTH domain
MNWSQVRSVLGAEVERSSQAMVADALSVSPSTLSRWMRGERAPLGIARQRVFEWAESRATVTRTNLPPVMQGQAVEIEALLAYALDRQQRLTNSLREFNGEAPAAVAR